MKMKRANFIKFVAVLLIVAVSSVFVIPQVAASMDHCCIVQMEAQLNNIIDGNVAINGVVGGNGHLVSPQTYGYVSPLLCILCFFMPYDMCAFCISVWW